MSMTALHGTIDAGFWLLNHQNLCTWGAIMYRNTNKNQLDIYDLILPFGGHLKEDNRWGVLRRRKSAKKIRKELRYQLSCINRNLSYIEHTYSNMPLEACTTSRRIGCWPSTLSMSSRRKCWIQKTFCSRSHSKPGTALYQADCSREVQIPHWIRCEDICQRCERLCLYWLF